MMRVSSSMPVEVENQVAEWVDDESSNSCKDCLTEFGFFNRRHHCRLCGQLVCYKCNDHWVKLPEERKPQIDSDVTMSPCCLSCYLGLLNIDPQQHYETFGSTTGIPLVILNGALVTRAGLRPAAESFAAAGFFVVVPDICGLGARESELMSEGAVMQGILEAIAAANPTEQRAHVMGYSMGGFLGLKLIREHPEHVISLCIGGATNEFHGPLSSIFFAMPNAIYKLTSRNAMWKLMLKSFEGHLDGEDIERMQAQGMQLNKWSECTSGLMMEPEEGFYLDTLRTRGPVCIFTGSLDEYNFKHHERFAEAAKVGNPRSEAHVLEGVAHEAVLSSRHIDDVVHICGTFFEANNN